MPIAKGPLTRERLDAINTGFKALFQGAFDGAAPTYTRFTEVVSSTAAVETYAWLGQMPGMHKWIGERYIRRLEAEAYMLVNEKFADTVAVKRDAIEDDRVGTYKPAIRGMAVAAAEHPEELAYQALAAGFDSPCYDGQNFFDVDHPVVVDGNEVSVSNMQAGAGPAWYLLCTTRPVKPIIYQDRVKPELIIHDDPAKSDRVFMNDEFLYGTRSRGAAGYSYWQLAFGSKATLNAANFKAARLAMKSLKGDAGRPLNISPNLLIVPPSLEDAANELINMQRTADGADNPLYKTVEVLSSTWLA